MTLVLAGLLSSCLVTNKVDYDQPLISSELERIEPPAAFVALPVEPDESCERAGGAYMRFEIGIRDLNREETLYVRYLVNNESIDFVEVPLTGRADREPVQFCISRAKLNESCNVVEALVSSSLSPNRLPYETRDGDRAAMHWWVIGSAEDNPSASYLDCPEPLPDAGAP
jgi:hypothetical protein